MSLIYKSIQKKYTEKVVENLYLRIIITFKKNDFNNNYYFYIYIISHSEHLIIFRSKIKLV